MECGQIYSLLMLFGFPTDFNKMFGFLDRTQQRLTINGEPCEDVAYPLYCLVPFAYRVADGS